MCFSVRQHALAVVVGLVFHRLHIVECSFTVVGGKRVNNVLQNDPCQGYNGILHIQGGDSGGATGTLFFLHMVNQLFYAQQHNLLPWSFFTYGSDPCYDPQAHGWYNISMQISEKAKVPMINNGVKGIGKWPGAPKYQYDYSNTGASTSPPPIITNLTISGSHLWDMYFLPVSDYSPEHNPCQQPIPLVQLLQSPHIMGGIHYYAPYANRAWPYYFVPNYLTPSGMNVTLQEWYAPQRVRGAALVKQYIHPRPWVMRAVDQVFPSSSHPPCLAMHVREADKGAGRQRTPLERYFPYVQAFVEEGGTRIHLATDSSTLLQRIRSDWGAEFVDIMVVQPHAHRVSDYSAVFRTEHKNTTNLQALIDIYGMSKCSFFLHGASAMSEAVLYVNGDLAGRNVDLDDPDRPLVEEFRKVVANYMKEHVQEFDHHSVIHDATTLPQYGVIGAVWSLLALVISVVMVLMIRWKVTPLLLAKIASLLGVEDFHTKRT